MGIQFLNGVPYGTTRQIRELTQAEYDALPSSKYTDGILYCITDDGMVEGNKFAPVIYSNAEQEIGTWVDGRPLYAITKDLPPANTNQWTVGATLDSNCEIKLYTGYIIDRQYGQQFPIEGGFCYTNVNDYSGGSVGFNVFKFCPKQSLSAEGGKVTLYYTKTTDVPGSGKWSTYGVPNRHYSMEEQVIGTWIDGKPLYEKTLKISPSTQWQTGTSIPTGITNPEFVKITEAYFWDNESYDMIGVLPYNQSSTSMNGDWIYQPVYKRSTNVIVLKTSAGFNADSNRYLIFVLQYTKTTD